MLSRSLAIYERSHSRVFAKRSDIRRGCPTTLSTVLILVVEWLNSKHNTIKPHCCDSHSYPGFQIWTSPSTEDAYMYTRCANREDSTNTPRAVIKKIRRLSHWTEWWRVWPLQKGFTVNQDASLTHGNPGGTRSAPLGA